MQLQRVCHDALPWLISFSLGAFHAQFQMHFFYLDESGDSGANLTDPNQPIMVLGGISLRDEGWNTTHAAMLALLRNYISGAVPPQFELHAKELLAPQGEGVFAGHPMERRTDLAHALLQLLHERKHGTHYFAIHKQRMAAAQCPFPACYNLAVPYLVAFDYLITYINWPSKERKEQFHNEIEAITHDRRFGGPAAHRVKWIVEFSYSVDSRKNPMIQLSDLVALCVRRFLEIECGYRENWTSAAKQFYAEAFALVADRLDKVKIEPRNGRHSEHLNEYLTNISAAPRPRWRKQYGL
jgi:hypothetical protein